MAEEAKAEGAKESVPLLKFVDDKAVLAPEGMKMIKESQGKIFPVILMGDGRAGKSYLASRILNLSEVFVTSDSAEPVTEGIDAVIEKLSDVRKRAGEELKPGEEDINIMVLDCEGGNNAMAAIRTLVNVFGIIIGTEVLYVAGGSFSEASIQTLGASLAARSLIKVDGQKLQAPNLVFVVNKNTLKFPPDTLEKSLNTEQADAGRKENRQIITNTFPERKFFAIPFMGLPGFEEAVSALRSAILGDARPLKLGDTVVMGEQLAGVLELMTDQLQNFNEVSLPSMSRYVIMDGYLKPLAGRIYKETSEKIPELQDYDPDLKSKDPRQEGMLKFDKETAHITDEGLVSEARQSLWSRLDASWVACLHVNEVYGNQTQDTTSERRETPGNTREVTFGGHGILGQMKLEHQDFSIETRQIVHKKNGLVEAKEWTSGSGMLVTRIVQTAFRNFNAEVPTVSGKMKKKSPNLMSSMMSGVVEKIQEVTKKDAPPSAGYQERLCVVKEGHLLWWDAEKVKNPDQEVNGSLSFILNRAEVELDDKSEFVFKVRPAKDAEKWQDATHFTAGRGGAREIIFSCEGTEKTRDEWVTAIKKNISFGDLAFQELGEERIRAGIAAGMPTLAQARWGAMR